MRKGDQNHPLALLFFSALFQGLEYLLQGVIYVGENRQALQAPADCPAQTSIRKQVEGIEQEQRKNDGDDRGRVLLKPIGQFRARGSPFKLPEQHRSQRIDQLVFQDRVNPGDDPNREQERHREQKAANNSLANGAPSFLDRRSNRFYSEVCPCGLVWSGGSVGVHRQTSWSEKQPKNIQSQLKCVNISEARRQVFESASR